MDKKFFTLVLLLITGLVYGQTGNINNTLGTGGSFLVKDGTTTFLSLSQSTGDITLTGNIMFPYSGQSTQGVIFKGGLRFIHDFYNPATYGLNTFVGLNSGNFTMGGTFDQASDNTGIGALTLNSLTTGSDNTAVGTSSLQKNSSGSYNTAAGSGSLYNNSTGSGNSAFGFQSLILNTTGERNSAFGEYSLYNNTTGQYNSSFGSNSLLSNSTGNDNSAFGYNSLNKNTTGISNCAFGSQTLYNNTTGQENSAFGYASLNYNTSGSFNSAFGYISLFVNSTGFGNSAFGYFSLSTNTTGSNNSAFGNSSLTYNSSGYYNSAFGGGTLYNNTTGRQNTAVGYKSLFYNTTGFQNTAIGDSALYNNTGNYNTAIGYNAGSNVTTGANLTLIGIDANPSAGTAIDEITLGNIYVSKLRCNATTITSLSDRRDKKNITELTLGLDFIMKLRPRQYNWDKRDWYENKVSDGSKMQQTPTAGFIAQELDSLQTSENVEWLDLVLKTNPDKWEATPGNLFPIVVKAIQELKQEKDVEIENLKNENLELKIRLGKYEAIQTTLIKKLEQIESSEKLFKVQLVNKENNNQ